MRVSEFSYDLPEELIAQEPLERRDASRMLVVNRLSGNWIDSKFSSFPSQLNSNDVVVVNDTRVFPARLSGKRETGGRVEIFLVKEISAGVWKALIRSGHRVRQGSMIRFNDEGLTAKILDGPGAALRTIGFSSCEDFEEILAAVGSTPIPPYIKRTAGATQNDKERYQTIYANQRGAIAAPTAGLHFTPEILWKISSICSLVKVTLHVGYGTFEPIRVDDVSEHHVAAERFEISSESANAINRVRKQGGRVIVVGTTTLRALESASDNNGVVQSSAGDTDLTITPGYDFRVTDALLTNFHLPQSSLLLLVASFGGKELILSAYCHAVRQRYRFYSYGDCMLIV